MNKEIELLNKKLEAQDKIINTQALEIAKLKEENLEIARLRPLVDLLKEENNGVRKSFNDLQQKIDKATEYIKERFEINEYGEYYFTHTFDKCNMRELLEILGEKENE